MGGNHATIQWKGLNWVCVRFAAVNHVMLHIQNIDVHIDVQVLSGRLKITATAEKSSTRNVG